MADFDRFRSFAERYVVERAGSFRTGFEQEDAFAAVLDAKGIYNNIAAQAKYMDQPEQGETTQSPSHGAGQQAVPPYAPYRVPRQQMRVALPSAPVVLQPALGLRSYVRNILKGGQA